MVEGDVKDEDGLRRGDAGGLNSRYGGFGNVVGGLFCSRVRWMGRAVGM